MYKNLFNSNDEVPQATAYKKKKKKKNSEKSQTPSTNKRL